MIRNPAPLLCFLSDNENTIDLCLRYWSLNQKGVWSEKVESLLAERKILRQDLLDVLREACLVCVAGVRCRDCGTLAQVTSRSDYTHMKSSFVTNRHLYQCIECAEADRTARQAAVALEAEQKRAQLLRVLGPIEDNLTIEAYGSLSYVNAFFLYCLLVAAGEGWQGREIASVRSQPVKLAPTLEMSAAICLRLHSEGILTPASSSSPSVFHFTNETSGRFTFAPLDVNWILALDEGGYRIEGLLTQLENVVCRPDASSAEELWSTVAGSECERYFTELCERYRFSKDTLYTEKVKDAIKYCLERLALPQVWNVLWCTMRNIAALIQEGTYIRPHVYNMISGNIRRDVDRRLANDTSIRPWGRLRPHEEAVVTGILFDKTFKRGTVAFESITGKNVRAFIDGLPDE